MSNLIDIQTQIQKLQKQAEEIRAKEFDKTVEDLLMRMHAYGITVKDLQRGMGKVTAKAGSRKMPVAARKSINKKRASKTKVGVPAKYRGPNGETWSGRGLTPRWLTALLNQGRRKEEFAI
jgi:DNA-binding protein H-NS